MNAELASMVVFPEPITSYTLFSYPLQNDSDKVLMVKMNFEQGFALISEMIHGHKMHIFFENAFLYHKDFISG